MYILSKNSYCKNKLFFTKVYIIIRITKKVIISLIKNILGGIMKKIVFFFFLTALLLNAQNLQVASWNSATEDPTDPNRAYANITNHVRGAVITDDLDGDGKNEILAVDYSNNGRVHCLEYNNGQLELVWSSPANLCESNHTTPRWVQFGDLDGDGHKEIIFPSGKRYDGKLQVFENVGDNDYGTASVIDFPSNIFEGKGVDLFRMDRDRDITVADFDNDGQDEIIVINKDSNIYILSINGNAPGFASWIIEGGDPATTEHNRFSKGSQYHSIFLDYDGDGTKEIVNHYWNFYGFWSIEATAANTYTYPSQPNPDGEFAGPTYIEFMKPLEKDAVAYMGVLPCDVDGDGKEEIAGSFYVGGGNEYNNRVSLISLPTTASGVEVWAQDQFAIIKDSAWTEVGMSSFSMWGNGVADLDGDGDDEIVLGGAPSDKVLVLDYKGTGSILDGANYTTSVYDVGTSVITGIKYYDSLGVTSIDTSYNGFIAKMDRGDLNGNGKDNLVLAYQSIADSVSYQYFNWSVADTAYVEDSTKATTEFNTNAINIRVIEGDNGTGIKVLDMNIISPKDYVLEQNYPNPFNPSTKINFSIPLKKKISITVYDMLGKEVKTLVNNEEFAKGNYEAIWDGTNNFGSKVASGNYIATMKFGNFSKSIKMQLLK